MDLAKHIEEIITKPFEDAGVNVVCVYILNLSTGMKIQVLIERSDDNPVSVNDCVFCNRTASTLLDVENIIKKEYTLEVSSPGEYRPLTKIRDFERFAGNLVKVELCLPVDGIKRFKGVIDRVEHCDGGGSRVFFRDIEKRANQPSEPNELSVMFSDIHKATIKREFKIC